MKTTLLALFCAASLLTMTGCAGSMQQIGKSIESETGAGLHRKVTMYSFDGKPILCWEGRIYIEGAEGDSLSFLLDGKRITIAGHYLIEEL